MKVHQGTSVLCTGAGSGIGRETVLALARLGADVTVVDLSEEGGRETVRLIEDARHTLFGRKSGGPPVAIFVKCDVTKAGKTLDCDSRQSGSQESWPPSFTWNNLEGKRPSESTLTSLTISRHHQRSLVHIQS